MDDRSAALGAALTRLLAAHGLPGTVEDLQRLTGGASRETWALTLVAGEDRRPLILQRLRGAGMSTGPGLATEVAVLRAAAAGGVPVATVVAHDDDGAELGTPGMVLERLHGETIARKLLRDEEWAVARGRLVEQSGAALAAVHRIDVGAVPGLREADQLAELRGLLDGFGQAIPAFELGLRWLADHRPPRPRRTVVHGDYRLGNLLVDADGLRGVLDWELAHIGDPVEDLGWYCVRAWRFGSPLPAGGTGTREELLAAYEAAGGGPVDPEALRWWELLGTIKWGLFCLLQAHTHLSGASRSVELAAIGRRVAENEWDALGLLPGGPLPGGAEVDALETAPGLYGRPTAAELVEAVREWIDDDVRSATSGRVSFHALVAVNALKVVERELALGEEHRARHAEGLARLGVASDAELSEQIRSGAFDDRADEVRQVVAASVRHKLEVANPRWLESS